MCKKNYICICAKNYIYAKKNYTSAKKTIHVQKKLQGAPKKTIHSVL